MLFLHLLKWLCGFVYYFVYEVYHIDWFAYVEPHLWTWHESNLVVVYDLVYVLDLAW